MGVLHLDLGAGTAAAAREDLNSPARWRDVHGIQLRAARPLGGVTRHGFDPRSDFIENRLDLSPCIVAIGQGLTAEQGMHRNPGLRHEINPVPVLSCVRHSPTVAVYTTATGSESMRTIYLIVCGAEPAGDAGVFVNAAHIRGIEVVVFASPAAARFIDRDVLAAATGHPVNSEHRPPNEPRRPRPLADAVVIAPATANTVCKLAAGIADTYALDVASENIALGVPVVLVPFVNSVLERRAPYQRALARLQEEGVRLLDVEGHEPQDGAAAARVFPWAAAIEAAS